MLRRQEPLAYLSWMKVSVMWLMVARCERVGKRSKRTNETNEANEANEADGLR